MTGISNSGNAEHYTWGNQSDGWHLLNSDELSIIEEKVPAGEKETRHIHSQTQQFFYILDGQAEIEIEGELFKLSKNDGIHVKAGAAHQLMNNSTQPLRFIVVSQPKSHGDRTDAS